MAIGSLPATSFAPRTATVRREADAPEPRSFMVVIGRPADICINSSVLLALQMHHGSPVFHCYLLDEM